MSSITEQNPVQQTTLALSFQSTTGHGPILRRRHAMPGDSSARLGHLPCLAGRPLYQAGMMPCHTKRPLCQARKTPPDAAVPGWESLPEAGNSRSPEAARGHESKGKKRSKKELGGSKTEKEEEQTEQTSSGLSI
eukprot:g16459.t1